MKTSMMTATFHLYSLWLKCPKINRARPFKESICLYIFHLQLSNRHFSCCHRSSLFNNRWHFLMIIRRFRYTFHGLSCIHKCLCHFNIIFIGWIRLYSFLVIVPLTYFKSVGMFLRDLLNHGFWEIGMVFDWNGCYFINWLLSWVYFLKFRIRRLDWSSISPNLCLCLIKIF